MKRIKISIGLLLALLTGFSILVTNFVVLIFWAGDTLHQEGQQLQQHLIALRSIASKSRDVNQLSQPLESLLANFQESCARFNGTDFPRHHAPTRCAQRLQQWTATFGQLHTSQKAVLLSNSLIQAFATRYIYAAVRFPFFKENENSTIAVGVPVSRLFASLWNKEQIIAVYLVFNACILTTLAFFRFYKIFVQPVDAMVREADAYRGDDGLHPLFWARPADEWGQLARSIQSMVNRIEADKGKLTIAVKELAQKNALLQENQRQMIRAEKMATVGRLGAGLAHEIGNPLSVVQGYLQLLQMEGISGQDRKLYTDKALAELNRVDVLIRKLLDFARTVPGTPMRFDIHGLLTEVVEALRVQPSLRNIRLQLAAHATKNHVYADYNQLRQVLVNCIFNAVDAIQANPENQNGLITMETRDRRGDGPAGNMFLLVSIQDNGIGIPEDQLESVFDPFFTTKEPGAGTGLGLSVSRSLVHSSGGKMEIASKAGEGTKVTISLPIIEEPEVCQNSVEPSVNSGECCG